MAAVNAGLNVYADKPLVVNQEGFEKLQKVFEIAKEKNLFVYDIMTERFEVTTGIQKALSMKSEVLDALDGTHQNPLKQRECSPFVKNRSGNHW